jgi:Zn-dependent peptidase ImmA (M78 family)/DNA-binding XRE family transcriptional regulator
MTEKAFISPNILRWARETAKMSVEDVSHKIKVKKEKLIAWEKGENYPTINQLEKLSKIFRRPISVFYLPEPPSDFQTLRDFRKLSDKQDYSTALTFIIRDILSKQSWISDFLLQNNEEPLHFIGKYHLNSNIEKVASDIKNTLEIGEIDSNQDALKYWVDKIEGKRIFVSLSSNIHSHLKIDINEVKGFAVTDEFAPFIFVNSADSKNSQLFTLIHELVHLWVNSSGVSAFNLIDFRNPNEFNQYDPVEVFCNKVTAEILMPKSSIIEISKKFGAINQDTIEKMAKQLKVSSLALAVRLSNLKIISNKDFDQLKDALRRKYEEYLKLQENKPKQKGGPSYYLLKIRKNSKAFTAYIYSYYKSGFITGCEVNKLLDIKVSNFKNLEKHLYAR